MSIASITPVLGHLFAPYADEGLFCLGCAVTPDGPAASVVCPDAEEMAEEVRAQRMLDWFREGTPYVRHGHLMASCPDGPGMECIGCGAIGGRAAEFRSCPEAESLAADVEVHGYVEALYGPTVAAG